MCNTAVGRQWCCGTGCATHGVALMGSHSHVEGSHCREVGSSNSGAFVWILCCVQKLALITEGFMCVSLASGHMELCCGILQSGFYELCIYLCWTGIELQALDCEQAPRAPRQARTHMHTHTLFHYMTMITILRWDSLTSAELMVYVEHSTPLWQGLIDMLWSACSRTFFLGAYKCDLCTACTSPVLKQSLSQCCNLGVRYTGVKSGIKQEMCSSTRATIRMEEQMTSMMEKLDEQSQQIKCLTEKQSAQLEDMERRQ